jgi:uncharacterized membrane protein
MIIIVYIIIDRKKGEDDTHSFALSLLLFMALSFLSLIRFEMAVPRSKRFKLSYWLNSGRGIVSITHSDPT